MEDLSLSLQACCSDASPVLACHLWLPLALSRHLRKAQKQAIADGEKNIREESKNPVGLEHKIEKPICPFFFFFLISSACLMASCLNYTGTP